MINQDLINYIQKKLESSSTKEEIKEILLQNGWKEEKINEAFMFLKLNELEERIEPQITITKKMNSSKPSILDFPELPSVPTKQKRKNPIPLIIILLILAGTVFAYYYLKEPLLIFSKAIDKTTEIKSLETNNELNIIIDDELLNQLKQDYNAEIKKEYILNYGLSFDFIDSQNIKAKSNISFDNNSINADFAVLNNALYGIINNFNIDSSSFGFPQEQAQLFLNRWIKMPLNINPVLTQEYQTEYKNIVEIIKKHPQLIKNISRLPGEKNIVHYKLEINKNELINILNNYAASQGKQIPEEESNRIKEALKYFDINNFEIWINKKDNYITKIAIDVKINNLSLIETETKTGGIRIQYAISIYNHNNPLNFSEPENYINLEDLIILNSESFAKDSYIKAELDQLRSIAETYKAKNNQYSNKIVNNIECNKSLAKTFLENSTGGYEICEQIQNNSSGNLKIMINNLKGENAKYCIQKTLNNKQSWCIDSAGFVGYEEYCDSINFDCKNP
ncbi:MAG: hypothetical protein MCSN_5740 [Candidatus Microsyncoccus archaeolyticus]|nr:MAG: hypothetical protein MCSN_5740 [Candidatus Parcubacteria bacterium]